MRPFSSWGRVRAYVEILLSLNREQRNHGSQTHHAEFAEFLREWQKVLPIGADFKVVVADMQAFLVDLRRWLEQLELGIRSEPAGDVARIQREVIGELQGEMLPVVNSWFSRFDEV